MLELVDLQNRNDICLSPFLVPNGSMRSAPLYKALMSDPTTTCPYAKFTWQNRVPPRIRFVWLLSRERIQCKSNLLKKHIVMDDVCDVCKCADETPQHLIFTCSFSRSFWQAIGVLLPSTTTVTAIWEVPRPASIPPLHFDSFVLLVCSQLWKHMHHVEF